MTTRYKRAIVVGSLFCIIIALSGLKYSRSDIHTNAWSYANSMLLAGQTSSVPHDETAGWDYEPEITDFNDLGSIFSLAKAYPSPQRDLSAYSKLPPMNYLGPGGNAFAALLCTRNATMRDPYFANVQSIVWRLLWSPYATRQHAVIIFVCPFTSDAQRNVLRGQGAIVEELPLLNVIPEQFLARPRWIDVMAKINIWSFTKYKRIAFLDSDAFPIDNLDEVFEIPQQECVPEKFLEEDRIAYQADPSFCHYTFAGVLWNDTYTGIREINAGFLLLSPTETMHQRLLRSALKIGEYDPSHLEQGLFRATIGFGIDGPFPAHFMDPKYNAGLIHYWDKEVLETAKVIHSKLWVKSFVNNHPYLKYMWDTDWMEQCQFYDSTKFHQYRVSGSRDFEDLEVLRLKNVREKQFLIEMTMLRKAQDEHIEQERLAMLSDE